MAFEAEAEALAAVAASKRRGLIERLRRLGQMATIRAYRRVLLDTDGALTTDAAVVVADLARIAGIGFVDSKHAGTTSDAELRERAGARRLFLHLMGRLDLSGEQLRTLARQTMEQDR